MQKNYLGVLEEEQKDLIMTLLERQFSTETLFDFLLRLTMPTGEIVTYMLSVFLYLYIRLIRLTVDSNKNYEIVTWKELKNNICFHERIDGSTFEDIKRICFKDINEDIKDNLFPKMSNGILIAPWMFDGDFVIFELIRERYFSNVSKLNLGKQVDFFGKNVIEVWIKAVAERAGWKVLVSPLKIKSTDFDLVAYKAGVIMIGQIKTYYCTRNLYSIWKAKEVIECANLQIERCKVALQKDNNLLYSNLKREKIVERREEIKKIIYIIISGNGYISGDTDVPVVSSEDWKNLVEMDTNSQEFEKFLKCPPAMYELEHRPEYRESVIDTSEYTIWYNELE